MADDDERPGFAFPLPMALLAAMSGDRHRMAHETAENDVFHLLDALTVEQLITLRRILNSAQESPSNNYVDGQVVSLLRVVHRVHHVTGTSLESELLGAPPDAPGPTDQNETKG